MQDRPTPAELIGAVAAFLKNVVAPETQGALSFNARVAANALEMMKRELETAPAEDAAELERLRALPAAQDGRSPFDPRRTAISSSAARAASKPAKSVWTRPA